MRTMLILGALLAAAVEATPPPWPEAHHHAKPATWAWTKPILYTPEPPIASLPPASKYATKTVVTSPVTTANQSHPAITASSTLPYSSGSSTSSTSTSIILGNACASVRELAVASSSADPEATPTVPAQLAYECINSVPFNRSAAVEFMDSIRPFLDWQTTVQYLKDPPTEYAEKIQPPYDFPAEFERIYSTANVGGYPNEYAFGFDLYRCFQRAHDGHFVIYPDSVQSIFSFGRTTPLVSVSLDGISIPQVYLCSDVLEATVANASFVPSPLELIDGRNSTEYLLEWSQYGSLQDRDALWNNMFYLLQTVSLGSTGSGTGTFSGGGRGRWIYPGPTTTLTLANGTSITNENFARVLVPFDNITSGADIYQQYFTTDHSDIESAEELATQTTSSTTSASSTSTVTTAIPAPGFPSAIIRGTNNLNSGYFLDGEGYDDVAILSLASFGASRPDPLNFQSVNTYLVNRAVAANKTKLIIDVSANGGGLILQGYDLFKLLFPSILPYGATRFRAHEAFDLVGQEISYFSGLVPRSLESNETVKDIVSSAWNYRTDADVNYEPFTSWSDKYNPVQLGPGGDKFTSIIRWNLSDIMTPENSGGPYVSGYLNRSNITTQPFAAENIVIVTDGYCASTCTIFSELMKQQAGVRTVILGGRPNSDIAQAIGGVKGTNSIAYDGILSTVQIPFTYEYVHSREFPNSTALAAYNDLVLARTVSSVVNARDGYREGDETNTPLQFVYEPADCRIYYTPEMAVDQTAAWKTVADAAWNGIERCVASSLVTPVSKEKRKMKRRSGEAAKHPVRRSLNTKVHSDAAKNVWTGRGRVSIGGDSVMIP